MTFLRVHQTLVSEYLLTIWNRMMSPALRYEGIMTEHPLSFMVISLMSYRSAYLEIHWIGLNTDLKK
jgi:hypothetical protein